MIQDICSDLYFKKYIKDIILKNVDDTKYYKSYIIKKNILDFNYKTELQHYSEKFNIINIINNINNIENLEKNDEYLKPYLIKSNTTDYQYDIDKLYEDLDKVNFIKSGNSITCINHMGYDIKVTECELIQGINLILKKSQKYFIIVK